MAEGVRFRDDEFEAKCDYCLEWWPLDRDFWQPHHGMRRCRACLAEHQRGKNVIRRADPVRRQEDVESMKAYRRANKDALNERRRAYYRANRERINELARKRRAERLGLNEEPRTPIDAKRRRAREWMRQKRAREYEAEARAA